jgi:hypothetical protein
MDVDVGSSLRRLREERSLTIRALAVLYPTEENDMPSERHFSQE